MPRNFVVVGAGVLGVCVAACLAEAGADVTLLEQAEPGHAATRSSFAWLNSNNKTPRAYHDLNYAGMRAWAELARPAGPPGSGASRPPMAPRPPTAPVIRPGTGRTAISNGRTAPRGTRNSPRGSAASPNGDIRPP